MELSYEATALAWIVAGVVVLWVTEILPLPVSALLAASACVVAGVAPAADVFSSFSKPLVFLFIGSFMLAEAIRVHRLDRRLAFAVLALPLVGERPVRIMPFASPSRHVARSWVRARFRFAFMYR